MGEVVRRLLLPRSWRAFDVDDHGRVLAGSDSVGQGQLVELEPDGSARFLTALPGPCRGRYLPGERTAVVEYDTSGRENFQLGLLRLDPVPTAPAGPDALRPLTRHPRSVHRLHDVLPGGVVFSTNRRNDVDCDVVVHRVAGGAEQTVYDGGGLVRQAAIAPGGGALVITLPAQRTMSDQMLYVGDGSAPVALTDAGEAARYERVHWQGTSLLVTTDSGRNFTGLAEIDPRSGHQRWLATDEHADLTGWRPPGRGDLLLVVRSMDGVDHAELHRPAARPRPLAWPDAAGGGVITLPHREPVFSPNGRFAALSFTSWAVPGDVVLLDLHTGQIRSLTDSAASLAGVPLVEPACHRVPTHDGQHVPCFVYAPADPPPDLAGSAVLVLHGGPEETAVRRFHRICQSLAAAGHTVLVPNIRGSTGYGKHWYSADDRHLRVDCFADLETLHRWLPDLGCDPKRAALWGFSYGGYLVLAGLARQPELWAAGVSRAGISSLVSYLEGTSGYRRTHREREYGTLEHDRSFLASISPMTDVHAIRAPLLLMHGENDPRVPVSESRQIEHALLARGAPVEAVYYDDEGHGFAKLHNKLAAYPQALAFLRDALGAS